MLRARGLELTAIRGRMKKPGIDVRRCNRAGLDEIASGLNCDCELVF